MGIWKYELAGIDYFSEFDSFYLHDSDGEQTVGCIRLFRSTDKEIANIISSKFVRPLILPEKITDYEKLYCEDCSDRVCCYKDGMPMEQRRCVFLY